MYSKKATVLPIYFYFFPRVFENTPFTYISFISFTLTNHFAERTDAYAMASLHVSFTGCLYKARVV